MSKNTTPDQVAKKWATNLGNAGQSMKDGVTAVTESPMAAAARSLDLMRQNFLAAIDSGKVLRGLQRKTLDDWKNAMLTKGVSRIQQGAQQGQGAVQQFQAQWLPFIRAASNRIKAMPKGGMANAMARIQANLEAAASFKRS